MESVKFLDVCIMQECSNRTVFDQLSSTFDRIDEAAWFIRLMEEHYHLADKFRWSLNSFLRALKEIMQLASIEVQKDTALIDYVRAKKKELYENPLIFHLYKKRDIVVHKSMLKPASNCMVGFTRGRGMKLGMGLPIDPLSDSEEAIKKYIYHSVKNTDFMGILYTEDDGGGEFTCVQREWKLSQFPDDEITKLCANAWEKVTQAIFDIAAQMGAQLIKPNFKLGNPNKIQFEIYNPAWVKEQLEICKKWIAEKET